MLDRHDLPFVAVLLPNGAPWLDWIQFLRDHNLGIASQRSYARSVGAFLDYAVAEGHRYADIPVRQKLFQAFSRSLIMGTVRDGADSSGLFWLPKSVAESKRIVQEVTRFSDWLTKDLGVNAINPARGATASETVSFWTAWNRQSNASLLRHLRLAHRARSLATNGRTVGVPKTKLAKNVEAKAFPNEHLGALLKIGFKRESCEWSQLRDQLIVLLMAGGGLRISECLHLWVQDVHIDPEDSSLCVVRIHHPSDGLVTYADPHSRQLKEVTRSAFLRLSYNRVPLTDIPGQRGVGWKNPLLQDSKGNYIQVFWIGDDYSRTFLTLYKRYCAIRPRVRKHPYLFITKDLNPLYVRSFEKNYAVAIRRIGLIPGKRFGTSPHGHRHSYGKLLHRARVDPKVIQIAMHHRSIFSQEIYTTEDLADVASAISAVQKKGLVPTFGVGI